jgi:hypothetical protein
MPAWDSTEQHFLDSLKQGSQSADAMCLTSEAHMSGMIDEDPTDNESAKRWRNFGKDRLYVNEANGCAIGWLELKTRVWAIIKVAFGDHRSSRRAIKLVDELRSCPP